MCQFVLRATVAAAILIGGPVASATFDDPTWPCIQRKVETLSPALMWPADFAALAPVEGSTDAIDDLAATLSLRRLDEDQLRAAIERFDAAAAGPDAMAHVFQRVFDRMANRRTKILDGIAEYSLGQIDLAQRIEAARADMDAQMDRDTPDFDRVDALEEQIAWDERIYNERRTSLTYVCETPQLLEQRLYAIAQILQDAAR